MGEQSHLVDRKHVLSLSICAIPPTILKIDFLVGPVCWGYVVTVCRHDEPSVGYCASWASQAYMRPSDGCESIAIARQTEKVT